MTTCALCYIEFPLLVPPPGPVIKCPKCAGRKPGLPQADLITLSNRPQCIGCGVVTSRLRHPLCNRCILHYQNAETIPRNIITTAGVADLLTLEPAPSPEPETVQATASDLLHDAYQHKEQASDSRLGRPKSTAPGLNKFKNLKKAVDVRAERKAKKEDFDAARKNHILISGALWFTSRIAGDNMVRVPLCKGNKLFPPHTSTQAAFDTILHLIRAEFTHVKPNITVPLTWGTVSVYAQIDETTNGYASLQGVDRERPLTALLEEFQNHRWGKPQKLQDRQLAVRFVALVEELDVDDDEDDRYSKKASSARASKRKRENSILQSSKSSIASSRGFLQSHVVPKPSASTSSSGITQQKARPPVPLWPKPASDSSRPNILTADSEVPPHSDYAVDFGGGERSRSPSPHASQSRSQESINLTANSILTSARLRTHEAEQFIDQTRPPAARRSAFQPPAPRTHWTRNPITLQAHPFKKITCSYAEDGRVTFSKSDVEDSIEIPHPKEWELENAAGFIGKGASKRGLYARYKGMEYVITQPMDEHLAHDDVELILKKEMELLCQCHGFKKVFDQHAVGNLCNIVAFKFNFEDAFIGELKPSMTSQSRPLPRLHFLATPLLPCGSFDKKIQKFTGNDVVGEATTAHHEAIHAFAHFSYLYSQGYLVFCDLQGMLDKTGIMCLIDPQVHTRAVKREDRHAYWDGGPNMVNKFLEDHYKGCSSNRYCKRLKLCGANPETFEIDIQPSHPSPRRPEKKPKKHDLNFLINGQ